MRPSATSATSISPTSATPIASRASYLRSSDRWRSARDSIVVAHVLARAGRGVLVDAHALARRRVEKDLTRRPEAGRALAMIAAVVDEVRRNQHHGDGNFEQYRHGRIVRLVVADRGRPRCRRRRPPTWSARSEER